jgi:hypothetical protein
MFLSILFLFTLISPCVNAVDYIAGQDQQRVAAFDRDQQASDAMPYTQRINTHLVDHDKIDYSRTATDGDKAVIFCAVFGEVIVHGRTHLASLATITDSRYLAHCNALHLVAEAASFLWQAVLQGNCWYSLDQCAGDFARMAATRGGISWRQLFTGNFMGWFYYALGNYRPERNLFGGAASVQWLQEAAKDFTAGRRIDRSHRESTHSFIHGSDDKPVYAVMKSRTDDYSRKGIEPWIVWMFAQVANLGDVTVPALPVRVSGGQLVVTTVNPTHTIEPFAGVVGSDDSMTFYTSNPGLDDLFTHIVANSKQEDSDGITLKLRSTGSCRAHVFGVRHVAKYFENHSVDAAQRWKDLCAWDLALETMFRNGGLLRVIAFSHIFQWQDGHTSNLPLFVDNEGNLHFRIIDYGLCFTGRVDQLPPIAVLRQATLPLPDRAVQWVKAISERGIQRTHTVWPGANAVPLDTLLGNVRQLRSASAAGRTLRQIAEILYEGRYPGVIKRHRSVWDLLLLPTTNLTIWDPLTVRASPLEVRKAVAAMGGLCDYVPGTEGLPGYRVLEAETILEPIKSIDPGISSLPWKKYCIPLPGSPQLDWCFAVGNAGGFENMRFVTLFSSITQRAWDSPINPTEYIYSADILHQLSF